MGKIECYMMRLSDPLVLCTYSVSATGEGVWECAGDARALESSKSLLRVGLPFTTVTAYTGRVVLATSDIYSSSLADGQIGSE